MLVELGPALDNVFDAASAIEFRVMVMTRIDRLVSLTRGKPAERIIQLAWVERMLVALQIPSETVDWFMNYAMRNIPDSPVDKLLNAL